MNFKHSLGEFVVEIFDRSSELSDSGLLVARELNHQVEVLVGLAADGGLVDDEILLQRELPSDESTAVFEDFGVSERRHDELSFLQIVPEGSEDTKVKECQH